jgi:hypothetical protein
MANRRAGGKFLQCLPVTDNIAIGISTIDELETYGLKRPTLVEDAKKKELGSDAALAAAHTVRELVQRRFDSARRRRAVAYGTYLSGLLVGNLQGAVPPITLFCPTPGAAIDGGLRLPHSSPLVTLDGETQTEARFALRETEPDSGEVPLMFVLYHGIDAEHAGTIMHDFNVYAHPVAENKVSALNHNGALTAIVNAAIADLKIEPNRIARYRQVPGKNQIAAYEGLIAGAAGALLGRTLPGSLNANIRRLNAQRCAAEHESAKPFVVHALTIACEGPGIGHTKPTVWALAGGIYRDFGKLLTASEWQTMATAYATTRPPRGSRNVTAEKTRAAILAIGITQIEGRA